MKNKKTKYTPPTTVAYYYVSEQLMGVSGEVDGEHGIGGGDEGNDPSIALSHPHGDRLWDQLEKDLKYTERHR